MFYGSSGYTGIISRGRISGGISTPLMYPSPFFDIGHTYMPRTLKELFRWCRYYFFNNSVIHTIIAKLASYPLTDVIIDEEKEDLKKLWQDFLTKRIRIKEAELDAGLDYHCYGNAFMSIAFPFNKILCCSKCGWPEHIRRADYKYRGFKFFLKCRKCGNNDPAKVDDVYIKNPHGIRIIRWNPEYMEIRTTKLGLPTYHYNMTPEEYNALVVGRPDVLEYTPQLFIEAAKKSRLVGLSPGQVYHMRRPSPSTDYEGWGVSRLMANLKDAFFVQLMKKSTEALLVEHAVPFRVLFPQGGDPNMSVYVNQNLGNWKEQVNSEVNRFRTDPNYMPVMPIPLGVQNIGGDARALMMIQELQQIYELLAVGMGIPKELIFGGVSFCLHPDTYVITESGLVKAGTCCPDYVGMSPSKGKLYAPGEGLVDQLLTHNTGTRPGVRISIKNVPEMLCGEMHPFFVLSPGLTLVWKRAKDLAPGDFIASTKGMNCWPRKPVALNWCCHEKDGRNRRMKQFDVPKRMTADLARYLGYLAAEGYLSESRGEIGIAQVDKEVALDMARCAESVFGAKPSVRRHKSYNKKVKRARPCYNINVYGKNAVDFIRHCGLSGYSWEKQIPWSVMQSTREHVIEFIRGFVEGDGSVPRYKRKQKIAITSTSKLMLEQLQLLLMNLGIESSLYAKNMENGPETRRPMYQLHICSIYVDIYLKEVGFISSSKKKRLANRSKTNGSAASANIIPYLKESVNAFCDQNWPGRSAWCWESVDVCIDKDIMTTSEAAELIGVHVSMICIHIRQGRLKAKFIKERGNITRYLISKEDLEEFCKKYGRGYRQPRTKRKMWRAGRCSNETLGDISAKDPELADRIALLQDSDYVWSEVTSVERVGDIPTVDFTIPYPHAYWANGLISHNSGSSVSLRMLENDFLRYIEEQKRFANWIVERVAYYMEWRSVALRHRDFKMADDLNRLAMNIQLRQLGDLTRQTLLEEASHDPSVEDDIRKKEDNSRREESRRQALAQAEAQGELQLVQARYQQKIQRMMGGQQQQPFVDQMGGQQLQVNPAMAGPTGNPAEVAGYNLSASPDALVRAIREQPQQAPDMLRQLQANYPGIYTEVMQKLNPPSQIRQLPEQRPPRRSAEKALI